MLPTIDRLFADKSPILVEVRFPNIGTASDWYLCHEADELDPILDRVSSGVVIVLNSVFDVRSTGGGMTIAK